MHIASVGIDLGKTTFHLIALDDHGKIVARSKFSRKQLTVPYWNKGMYAEACVPDRSFVIL